MSYTKGMRLKFCIGDVIVIGFVIMLAILIGVVFWIKTGNGEGNTVVVYREGEKIQELSLNKNTEVFIENSYTNKLVVKDKKVAIVESDCPGMDCVHSGWISGKGRSLVCLPNRVEIRIEGEVDSEVDFIVR
ncbi:MAG: NusG domain II-containing protein [Lachnospiraceae bacterium]|nr:NusG domain II-containing protein [Lachnospiraceae bacterium]